MRFGIRQDGVYRGNLEKNIDVISQRLVDKDKRWLGAMNSFHTPVLLKEVIDFLRVKGLKYIDATLGGAGHTRRL